MVVRRPPRRPVPARAGGRDEVLGAVVARAEEAERMGKSRVEMMRSHAETRGCRRQAIQHYFGEDTRAISGHCDNWAEGVAHPSEPTIGRFPVGPGCGTSRGATARCRGGRRNRIIALFSSAAYHTLSEAAVRRHRLLEELDG